MEPTPEFVGLLAWVRAYVRHCRADMDVDLPAEEVVDAYVMWSRTQAAPGVSSYREVVEALRECGWVVSVPVVVDKRDGEEHFAWTNFTVYGARIVKTRRTKPAVST
jgi:hypothetical protein